MNADRLSFRALTAIAVQVPMKRPLGTSVQKIDTASLLLVNLETHEGITGHGYAFCYLPSIARALVPIVAQLSDTLVGSPLSPVDLAERVSRYFRLPGVTGPLAMVASSVDTAVWDATARSADMPLSTFLGGSPHPVPAYNSNGLGLITPEQAADEAEALLEGGFRGVKLRLGRANFEDDLAAVRAVRRRLADDIRLMVDFNQALTFAQAMQHALCLDGEGVYWIEEPIRHDDYHHLACIAQAVATPIQIGENFTGLQPMATALAARASDFIMLDLDRIGGVTGWQRAAGLAAAYGREVSSHLFPEVSAHLLAVTPGHHWLEYVDWANPILREPMTIADGKATTSSRPGNGLEWDAGAVARFRID